MALLLSSAAPAGAQQGEIVYIYGEVTVLRGSEELAADFGMAVGQEDTIATGPEAMALISLPGNTDLKLRENTRLSLDTLGETVSVHLSAGSVFSKVARTLTRRYSVRTETAVMGVRGTEFFVAYGRTIDAHPDIWVCVNSGVVEVSIPQTRQTLIVEQGKGINIVGGTTLTTPRRYPWTRKLNWNTDADRGEVIDRTDLEQAYSDLLDQDYD